MHYLSELVQDIHRQLGAFRAMDQYLKQMKGVADVVQSYRVDIPQIALAQAVPETLRAAIAAQAISDSVVRGLPQPDWSVTQSVVSMMEAMRPGKELAESIAAVSKGWQTNLAPLDGLRNLSMPPLALQTHLAKIASFSVLSCVLASRVMPESVGQLLQFGEAAQAATLTRFRGLSAAYASFYRSLEFPAEALLALPPALTERPAFEYFNEVDLLEATSEQPLAELEEDRCAVQADIAGATDEPLLRHLSKRFPDLVEPLQGSRIAFANRQPDFVRHCTTSLRELATHLLHRLSPDEEVKAWSRSEGDFHQGKPTRAARLRFICRGIDNDPLKDFVKKDVAATMEFFALLQAGTHQATSSFTDAQLRALMARMQGGLVFLLEISHVE